MNIHSILIRLLGALCACVVAAAPLSAAAAAALTQLVDAIPEECTKGQYEGKVGQVQQDLNRLYKGDANFKKDAGGGANSLNDGKLGRITRQWLGVFCGQDRFKVREAYFDADVAAELARFRVNQPAAAPVAAAPPAPRPPLEQTYRYDPAFPRKPRDLALMLPRLQTLTDLYANKALFDDAVGRALKGLEVDPTTRTRIDTFSTVDGYLLPSAKLDQLKGASPALLEKLMLKTDIDYVSADEFHGDLAIALGEGAEKAEYARRAAQIDGLARVDHYRIPATLAADLAAVTELEPPVAALYKPMAKVEYPSQDLFRSALRAHLERALAMCPADRYRKEGVLLAEGEVKALWALVESPPGALDQVTRLRAVKVRCTQAQRTEAGALVDKAHGVLYVKLENAAELSKLAKAPPPAGQAGPVAVAGCGCAHDASGGVTYGFYPLWTDSTGRQLDFDVLSRIGLYGLTVDDKGGLVFPAGVKTAPWTLLKAAHQHMTKVDWVVHKNDWSAATGDRMPGLLDNLRTSIVRLLRTPVPEPDLRGTALASFGLERGPSAGDGIVLRFERFPSNLQDQTALHGFVHTLANDLRTMKPARQLFVMVSQADVLGDPDLPPDEARPFSAPKLHALIEQASSIVKDENGASGRGPRADDLQVLVLVQEPTSSEKLLLRGDIERALFSNQRVRVLRNVIPVLEYDGVREGQLNDDILYFQDNFGGIGFWPLPFASAADDTAGSNTGTQLLRDYFRKAEVEGGAVSEIIDLICPNRTWLRWLAWISALAAIVAGVILARCHNCGTRLDNNTYYMAGMVALILLPFVVIAALVVGDPLFKSESGVHWVIAAILIVVVIVPGVYGLLKPVRKLP